MKKLSLVFAMLFMLLLCIGVSASDFDMFREVALNYTSESEMAMTFNTSDEFVAALEELNGEEMDLDGSGMMDAYMFFGSLLNIEGDSVIKCDISPDYNKIKVSVESAADVGADINKNLSFSATSKAGVWIDMDISDIANPKCLVIMSSPENKKYQYVDVFETMDEETRLSTLLTLKVLLNDQTVSGINDKVADMYEENATISKDGDTVTITIDNEGFTNIVDEVIDIMAGYIAALDPESAEDATEMLEFSLADLGIQFLGEKGIVMEYNKDYTECKMVCDMYINFNDMMALMGEEVPEMENELVLGFTITETQKIHDKGTTVIAYPELTEENSIDVNDEYFYIEDDYYDEYEPEYPYYFPSISPDYLPIVDGEIYVPFRAMLEEAYDGNVNIGYENGLITVTSEYFTDMETLSFKVGESKATVDGYDFEVGTILLENGVTYVSADFFEIVFGWELNSANYDLLYDYYYVEFYTDPYDWTDYEW